MAIPPGVHYSGGPRPCLEREPGHPESGPCLLPVFGAEPHPWPHTWQRCTSEHETDLAMYDEAVASCDLVKGHGGKHRFTLEWD